MIRSVTYRGVAKQKTIGGPLLVTKAVVEEGVATCGYMHSVRSALRACSPSRGVWGHAPPPPPPREFLKNKSYEVESGGNFSQ